MTELQAPEGPRYAMIAAYAYGTKPDYEDHANAGMYGQAVAQLHNHSDDFVTDHQGPRMKVEYLLDTSLDVVRPFLEEGSDDLEYLDKTADDLRQQVASVPTESLPANSRPSRFLYWQSLKAMQSIEYQRYCTQIPRLSSLYLIPSDHSSVGTHNNIYSRMTAVGTLL